MLNEFPPPGGMIARVCLYREGLFVAWLIRSFVTLYDLSKSTNSIFIKFGKAVDHLCQILLLGQGQGQGHCLVRNRSATVMTKRKQLHARRSATYAN